MQFASLAKSRIVPLLRYLGGRPRKLIRCDLLRFRIHFPRAHSEGGHLNSIATLLPVSLSPEQPAQATSQLPPLPDALQRVCIDATATTENKGQNVVVLDLREVTPLFDFFVIATGASRRQVHTIVEETDAALRAVGDHRLNVEGYDSSKWVVQDYGDVVSHTFDTDTRDYYKLEELWADAKLIDWEIEIDD